MAQENTVPVAPTMTMEVPKHGIHTERDSADDILAVEEKKHKQDLAEQSIQAMKGFITVYTCPNCRKRINPARSGGHPTSGICPHCNALAQPRERQHYVGDPAHKNLSDRYMKTDNALFKEGAKNIGVSGVNRRFNVRQGEEQ